MDPVNQVIAAILESENIKGGNISGGSRSRSPRSPSTSILRRVRGRALRGGSSSIVHDGSSTQAKIVGGSKNLEAGRVPKSLRRRKIRGGLGCEGRTWSQALRGVACEDARISNAKAYTK